MFAMRSSTAAQANLAALFDSNRLSDTQNSPRNASLPAAASVAGVPHELLNPPTRGSHGGVSGPGPPGDHLHHHHSYAFKSSGSRENMMLTRSSSGEDHNVADQSASMQLAGDPDDQAASMQLAGRLYFASGNTLCPCPSICHLL